MSFNNIILRKWHGVIYSYYIYSWHAWSISWVLAYILLCCCFGLKIFGLIFLGCCIVYIWLLKMVWDVLLQLNVNMLEYGYMFLSRYTINIIGDQARIYIDLIVKMLILFYHVKKKKNTIICLGRVTNFYFCTGECMVFIYLYK